GRAGAVLHRAQGQGRPRGAQPAARELHGGRAPRAPGHEPPAAHRVLVIQFDPPLEAVLFDMDGTLVRSGSYYLRQVVWGPAASPVRGALGPVAMVRLLIQFRRVRERLRVA